MKVAGNHIEPLTTSASVGAEGKNRRSLLRRGPLLLKAMLRRMMLIRAFDSQLPVLTTQSLIRGSSHSCIGQEAVAVGACFTVEKSDYLVSNHRGHGHTIAKGGDVRAMMAELFGRASGCCRGRGGSMHIADFSVGMLGANGIVGAGIGLATGAAFSARLRKSNQVVLCMFGDGAMSQGILLECGNMAALWKLPLVLVCENNQFSMSTRPEGVISTLDFPARLRGIGIDGVSVNGMDVLAVFDGVSAAVKRARNRSGPSFVEAKCYRFAGHFHADGLRYRSNKELLLWQSRDPISNFRDRLLGAGIVTAEEVQTTEKEIEAEVDEAVVFAKESPFPDPSTLWDYIYA
jgi:TPP-dependent pyruvate/acetoin dehydrogenase alpha subunit